jgi:hypothetical protein
MAMTEGKCASQTTPLPIFAPSKRKEQHDDNSPLMILPFTITTNLPISLQIGNGIAIHHESPS